MTAIVMMVMAFNGISGNVTEKTEYINANNRTKTVITITADGEELAEEYEYNLTTNEWELK
jgi:hypothetical protein